MKVVIVQIFLLISSNLQQKSSTFDRDRPRLLPALIIYKCWFFCSMGLDINDI